MPENPWGQGLTHTHTETKENHTHTHILKAASNILTRKTPVQNRPVSKRRAFSSKAWPMGPELVTATPPSVADAAGPAGAGAV